VEAVQITYLGDGGDGHGKLDPTERLKCVNKGAEPPCCHLLFQFRLNSCEPLLMVFYSPNVFLEDNLLGLSLAGNFGEPSQVSRTPICSAAVTDILPEKKRLEAEFGCLEVAHDVFSSPTQITYCFVFYLRDENRSEISRAHLASQVDSVLPVSLDTVSALLGNKGRGNDNAIKTLAFQVSVEAVTAGAGLVGEYEFVPFGLEAPYHLVDIALSSADRTQIDHIRLTVLEDVGYCDGILVNIKADEYCARLCHG
jgi:hypothetical protein